jgi:hypothetical protein
MWVERTCVRLDTVKVPSVPVEVEHVPEEAVAWSDLIHAKVTEDATMFASPAPVETVAS